MTTIVGHTSRAAGTVLTHTIYNGDHVVHITNATALNADKVEGAAGPVVDGHAALFLGTTGKQVKTAGFAPASVARQIITNASGGLSGGGDLSADRTLALILASQGEAEAGSEATKAMPALRVAQAIAARLLTLGGSILTAPTGGVDTGVSAVNGAVFLLAAGTGTGWQVSTNGGAGYTAMGIQANELAIVVVRGAIVVAAFVGASTNAGLERLSTAGGAGNIFFKTTANSGTLIRVL